MTPKERASKTCLNCNQRFVRPDRCGKKNWMSRKYCARRCQFELQRKLSESKTARGCIYCKRLLAVSFFGFRPSGLPLSYCKECGVVKESFSVPWR